MAHNFKSIQTVPVWEEFVDFVLSGTQKRTPTVIHRHYAISRIRDFYMRKVKFTQQSFHERLTKIIQDFPKIDQIHPFYCELINVLYDKDHYKIALSQINLARNIIDNVAREYVRLLKYGDSLYRCKSLKKVALGRMAKAVKNVSSSLIYLEQVRQHMSRLPSIDPSMRTIILCGFPNVGKSSFINKVTRADVEVQPYAFTTKSIYVGHTDYNYLRWQVIDTPGVLDHKLEERNTIEMQSITALAHLNACILYMMDISELCGYNISEQVSLFQSLAPLFANKPIVIGLNKIDVMKPENLSAKDKSILQELEAQNVTFSALSTMSEEGVMQLKQVACDKLLSQRVESKLNSKRFDNILNRVHIAMPDKRDNVNRDPSEMPFNTEAKLIDYSTEPVPEIMDGKNISDFVDRNIMHNLKKLLLEERIREDAGFYDTPKYSEEESKLHHLNEKVQEQKKAFMMQHVLNRKQNRPQVPKAIHMKRLVKRLKNERSLEGSVKDSSYETVDDKTETYLKTDKSDAKLSHDLALMKSGIVAERKRKVDALRLHHMNRTKKLSRKGEGDRHIFDMKPKHLFTGKRKAGKTARR